MYEPTPDGKGRLLNHDPYKMVASNFTGGGTILFRPHHIPDWENLKAPIPARFVSGHFFFTLGIHCKEYRYDPNIYFAGDEISLSIRSFTLGYDLYHPHKVVVWHEYTREGRTKHWTDFNSENKEAGVVDKLWWEMDNESKRRLRHMLQEEFHSDIDLGEYGLGTVRTHRDYEIYTGINFEHRKLHPKMLAGELPPTNDTSDWWNRMQLQEYSYELKIPPVNDFKFIYIGIESEDGEVLYRKDINEYVEKINIKFSSFKKPYKWVYWPMNNNEQWLTRMDTLL
jgi:hypothetical protein